ncbi:S41 family peptidase [Geobacter sp. DSM 9736]|uniref:S41 family peptidase n=1 Tax=Geobacter sp. DSM 9736 TaxID=1277350 RepID=UPI001E3662A0|nr:PDZ domain-containing protein [Geobacter sp. DSM 9736]
MSGRMTFLLTCSTRCDIVCGMKTPLRLLAFAATLVIAASSYANTSTDFGGIGIDGVPRKDGRIEVRQLVAGGPAHKAGIRIGDLITHVDSKPTRGSDFQQIVNFRLRGRSGTKVSLTVQRLGREKPLAFTLVRRQLVVRK